MHYTHTSTVPFTHFHMASSMYQIFSSSSRKLLNLHKTVSTESCDLMLNLQTCCQLLLLLPSITTLYKWANSYSPLGLGSIFPRTQLSFLDMSMAAAETFCNSDLIHAYYTIDSGHLVRNDSLLAWLVIYMNRLYEFLLILKILT